jgi:hypothetical protein
LQSTDAQDEQADRQPINTATIVRLRCDGGREVCTGQHLWLCESSPQHLGHVAGYVYALEVFQLERSGDRHVKRFIEIGAVAGAVSNELFERHVEVVSQERAQSSEVLWEFR